MTVHRRRPGMAGLILAGVAATLTTAAVPASAADPPILPAVVLHVVTESSGTDSATSKSATAVCDTGRVLGGGGGIVNGDDDVHLTRLQPLGSSDSFTASAMERGAYAPTWRVVAYAICGPAPAGLEYVSFQGGSSSGDHHTSFVTCPGTKKLIGAGGRIVGNDGHVLLTDVTQVDSAWSEGWEDEVGYAGAWVLWAFGVCVNSLPGLEIVPFTAGPLDSVDDTIIGTCPAGKRLFGVGATTGSTHEVLLTGVVPWTDLTHATVTAREDSTGEDGNWRARAYLTCAT